MQKNLGLDEALSLFLNSLPEISPKTEEVPLLSSGKRIISQSLISPIDSPSFTHSNIDGFALCSELTCHASMEKPVVFKIIGELLIGQNPPELPPGLNTFFTPCGAVLPINANAVIRKDLVNVKNGRIEINSPVKKGEGICHMGESRKKGSEFIRQGTFIDVYHLSALAEYGFSKIKVNKPPKVAIFSTGDEIVDINSPLNIGQIRDVNSYTMANLVKESGGDYLLGGIVKDDFSEMQNNIEKHLLEADLVLVTGGTAVGQRDFTAEVFQSLGKPGVIVNGIAVKNGRPIILAIADKKPLIGLPGYPPAAIIGFDLVVKPTIHKLLNRTN